MASGIYGRRVVDSHIRDDNIPFSQDRYPTTGAKRSYASELDSTWDKGNNANVVKNPVKNSVLQSHNSFGMPGSQLSAPSRNIGHKVAFHEPTVSYHEEFDPLHGSVTGVAGNLASNISRVQGGNKPSFIARDFRTNDFDHSRVTVRTKLPSDHHLPSSVENSPLEGTVISTRVLNDGAAFLKPKEKLHPNRHTKDLKSAGVATTVTHFDADQVYKHLRKEGIKKPCSDKPTSQSVILSGMVGSRSPLFQASPNAPCKRIDIIRQRKNMRQNSEALERLKEKIQRQKERSPSTANSPGQKLVHREEDPVVTMESGNDKPRVRKIAHGPAAPNYKGFSAAETRIRTHDGKVWKQGETNQPYIQPRAFQSEKRSRAASSLFNTGESKAKPPLTSGRLKPDSSARINKSKNQKLIRKTGKMKAESSIHKRSIITPASWREGQRIAESILGPPPKQPKKVVARDDQRPDSPPTRDTEPAAASQAKNPRPATKPSDIGNANSFAAGAATLKATSIHPAEGKSEKATAAVVDGTDNSEESIADGGMLHQKKMNSSIRASIPTDKLSVEARGVLDDLQLSSSDSDSNDEDRERSRGYSAPRKRKQRQTRGRSERQKHQMLTDPKDSKIEKASKARHYVQSEVQQYIAKQKADRKRKQSQERKAYKEAQERKQKQLEELYRKQKEAASTKKKIGDWEGRPRPLKQVDLAAMQALRRMDGILEGTGDMKVAEANESDKENMQTKRQQPLAKFDAKMSAFMEKLNQLESRVPPSPPATDPVQEKELEKRPAAATAPVALSSGTTSEFMQKLDRYLKNDAPVNTVQGSISATEIRTHPVACPGEYEPNLTVEDLGSVNETGSYRPQIVPSYRDRYGNPNDAFSPRYRQMMDEIAPSEEFTSKQRSRAERIAALRAKAESLQERIETESRKLVEQPMMQMQQPRLQEIDEILAKSGRGQSLPIHAWSSETRREDFRDSGPQWPHSTDRQGLRGVDVPDLGYPRSGLTGLSPSQLPGVAGLSKHVEESEKHKAETDAALKIQSAYRGHSVRQALDEWKLPSGNSVNDLRRQAASSANLAESGRGADHESMSEGPLSMRSESHSLDTPIKLRSVEEILADMKTRKYPDANTPHIDDMPLNKWTYHADDDVTPEHASGFLSDLSARTEPAPSHGYPLSQADADKPPWERSGGDKYSAINVFTSKYLKGLKEKQKHGDGDILKFKPDTNLSARSQQQNNHPKSSRSEHFSSPSSRKSPRAKSSEKYSPRFEDDTASDALNPLSSSVSEDLSRSRSYTSPRSREPIYQKDRGQFDIAPPKDLHEKPSEVLVGRVSYSSDEDGKVSAASSPSAMEEHFTGKQTGTGTQVQRGEKYEAHFSSESSDGSAIAPLPKRVHPAGNSAPLPSSEKKFSPAALEQKMSAELNYQESVEESLRHLAGVERTQGVSLAQQETVSLAQLMKARQLQHEIETERLTLKAKQEAFDAERTKAASMAEEEGKRTRESLKMQEASRHALETQAKAALSTAEAAKHLAHALNRKPRAFSPSLDRGTSRTDSVSTSETDGPREPASGSSSDAEKKGKKSLKLPSDRMRRQDSSPPSLMSEHSTTSVRLSDNDTQSSVPEQMVSTEEEDSDEKMRFKKLGLGKANELDISASDSITEELPAVSAVHDATDKTISEDIAQQSDTSLPLKREKSTVLAKKKHKDARDDLSDSSETSSVRFDQSLTEDEIAEISRRAVVASEVHRRHQRRRSPHTGPLDRSDVSSDDQPSLTRQKTPRGGIAASRGLDDFSIGPGLTGAADSEFVQFMDDMVRQYMLEEEIRAKHQDAMLKLRQRTIKEKTEAELTMLEKLKKRVKNKGEDEKMPPIKKKERAILRRFKMETDEIKKLKAVTKAASQERKMFLQQHKETAARRAKLRAAEEKLGLEGDLSKPRSKEVLKEPHLTSSTPIPLNANISDLPDMDVSESNSELDISSASSLMLKKLKTRSIDERRLTKREQRLMHRKKQAEQLIAWKKRLDREEKKVCDIEKQALSAWEKEGGAKIEKSKLLGDGEPQKKETKESDCKLSPKSDSSREESSSGKSPVSERHSSPPPASHSESSIAEEIIQINSGTNSSRSVASPEQNEGAQRNQEESSDGTNADDYSQSFDSVTASQRTPRSPKPDREAAAEKLKGAKPTEAAAAIMQLKKEKKDGDKKFSEVDSPSATPLLPSKKDDPSSRPTTSKAGTGAKEATSPRRRESAESWSDESFSQTQSEAEQSDIECRVRALKEELKRRRMIAERLKKEQKRRHKDRLKAQEASLRSQIEAYDVFIRKTQNELHQELGNQSSSSGAVGPVAKPQIRSPRKSVQAKQSARALRSAAAAVVSPEASPRSGSQKTPAILTKQRTESESSGKSSRSLSFDDEEKIDDVTPNGSTKSFTGLVAPFVSKHHDGLSSGGSTPTEKPKHLDLTDAAVALSKLNKPLSPNGFTSAEKPKSLIPVASKQPQSPSKVSPTISEKSPPSSASLAILKTPGQTQPSRKSLIPLPVSTSVSLAASTQLKEKLVVSSPSPQASEKSLVYSEDFESSAASKKTQEDGSVAGSVTTDEDISEHFSDVSGTSGERSDKSGTMLDLSVLPEKRKDLSEPSKDDGLHGSAELTEQIEKDIAGEEEDDEGDATPVVSPAQTPIPSSPRTPTPDLREPVISPFQVGDRVLLAGRETGIVRFVGETSFAPGIWVGAELQKANGKNDGSVGGNRYFTCSPKHGIFAPIARVSLLSPKSSSTTSARSLAGPHFEYGEGAMRPADQDKSSESELSKAISDSSKKLEEFAKPVMPTEPGEGLPEQSSPVKTGLDRNRLAEELSDRLLNSLLEDSVTHVLGSHSDKRQRQELEEDQEAKRRKKEDVEDETMLRSDDGEEIPLSASTKNLLEMLASSPDKEEELLIDVEAETDITPQTHESLADNFTGDLLQDTLTKVLEIRRQRAKKWRKMEEEQDWIDGEEDQKLDDGREIEDILEAKRRKQGSDEEEAAEDKESTTPVRPVSPILGASQDDGLDDWFEDDIGISSFHKNKPMINKEDLERLNDDVDFWPDGRLIEVLSSRIEPPPPPPKSVVPHRPEHILRLVEDAVDYYYSKYLRGELKNDVCIPDFLFNDNPDELSEREDKDSDKSNQEKKEADTNANHIFKTSLFDMVRELITEIYSTKSDSEDDDVPKRPIWLKKKSANRPSYCRRIPKTGEELVEVVCRQVGKVLDLSGDAHKLDPRITMKWGSRKKKDKVDLILIQELREEEPEWTNYDEDETTVKMQLTDTVLDMLLSDTVKCLDGIERRREERESVSVPAGEGIGDPAAEERSQ